MLLRIVNFLARWTLLFKSMEKSRFLVLVVRGIRDFGQNWTLVKRFTVVSSVVMLIGMAGIGWWVGEQIKAGVIKEATAATALYMDSFIAPNIQELGQSSSISSEHFEVLQHLFSENNLGQHTVSIKIWGKDNTVLYSNIPALMGRTFSDNEDLVAPWQGAITGGISDLEDPENIEERNLSAEPLLEIYSPVRSNDTTQIIAVAEFYQKVDTLQAEIIAAQRQGWLVVSITMLVIYFILIGFVQWASNRITQQEAKLRDQVEQLTRLLSYNKELANRVRVAAANSSALNEGLLRRVSAELHDGPVQEIGLALLRLDQAIEQNESCRLANPNSKCNQSLPVVQTTLQTALQEMRTAAAWLGLPQLDALTLTEVITHVIRSHEQRTGTKVTLHMSTLPKQTTLPIKIATYRFIQEGLSNAYRYADGKGQEVLVTYNADRMQIEILDQGSGFDTNLLYESDNQIGLAGMRERIESLGGLFSVVSNLNQGVKLTARLSLQNVGDATNG